MIWQLLQVRHLDGTPLILIGKMWSGLDDWTRVSMLSADIPLASAEDIQIPNCVNSADEALELIRKHHAQWLRKNGKPITRKKPRAAKPGRTRKAPRI